MKCQRIPDGIICGPDATDQTVTDARGKVWTFDFDERFGPLVLATKNGRSRVPRWEPAETQPGERSPFWPAFQAWLDARLGLAPACARCGGTGVIVKAKLTRRTTIGGICPDCNGRGRGGGEG